jgi:hypothetical protein
MNGLDWNAKEGSALLFILQTLCQSKFSLSSFLDLPVASFNFAQTGYVRILDGFGILENFASELYWEKIILFLKTVMLCSYHRIILQQKMRV